MEDMKKGELTKEGDQENNSSKYVLTNEYE